MIVYLDRDGYRDVEATRTHNPLSLLDCIYYATVSLSTTGYGDITPVTPSARLVNVLVITPLRIAFLIVLIGTTVETLTTQSRQALKIQRWRSRVRNHTIVVGYGTKGRTAVAAMVGDEIAPADIVVVDEDPAALERAKSAGLVTVRGSATDSEVLRLASAQHAKAIIVATNRDDAAVLVTLTARELAPERQDHRRGPGSREPAPARAVRRRLDRGDLRDGGPAAGHSRTDSERCRDDGRPADAGCRVRDRRTRGRDQGGRRVAAAQLPTSCSASCAGESCCASTTLQVDALELGDRLLYIRSAERRPMSRKTDAPFDCAMSRCCPGSAPTAPTRCAPTSTRRWPDGRMPFCCGSIRATRC